MQIRFDGKDFLVFSLLKTLRMSPVVPFIDLTEAFSASSQTTFLTSKLKCDLLQITQKFFCAKNTISFMFHVFIVSAFNDEAFQ